MKKHAKKVWMLVACLVIITGCTIALKPLWQKSFDENNNSFTFLSQDKNSVYLVQDPLDANPVITQYDLDGRLLRQQTLPISFRLYSSDLYTTDDDAFYIRSLDASQINLAYYNATDGQYWSGINTNGLLTADETLSVESGSVNHNSQLVFTGFIWNSVANINQPVAGIVDRNGLLLSLRRLSDNLDSLTLYSTVKNGDFYMMGRYSKEAATASGNKTIIMHFDNDLNELSSIELPQNFYYRGATRFNLIGYITDPGAYRVVKIGDSVEDLPLAFDTDFVKYFAGQNSFYRLSYKPINANHNYRLVLCNFKNDFSRNWCKSLTPSGPYDFYSHGAVGANDELALDLKIKYSFVSGIHGAIITDPNAITGNVGMVAQNSTQVIHLVFSADGKMELRANEDPYIVKKNIVFCDGLNGLLCYTPRETIDGVCTRSSVLPIPGNRILAMSILCHGDGTRNQHLVMWGQN